MPEKVVRRKAIYISLRIFVAADQVFALSLSDLVDRSDQDKGFKWRDVQLRVIRRRRNDD